MGLSGAVRGRLDLGPELVMLKCTLGHIPYVTTVLAFLTSDRVYVRNAGTTTTGREHHQATLRRSQPVAKLAEQAPHGVVLHEDLPLRPLKGRLQHPDGKIHLAEARVIAEIGRLEREQHQADPELPYRLIGLREVRSHNSWMHNSAKLMFDSRRLLLRMHPDDAAFLQLAEGDEARITSTAVKWSCPSRSPTR